MWFIHFLGDLASYLDYHWKTLDHLILVNPNLILVNPNLIMANLPYPYLYPIFPIIFHMFPVKFLMFPIKFLNRLAEYLVPMTLTASLLHPPVTTPPYRPKNSTKPQQNQYQVQDYCLKLVLHDHLKLRAFHLNLKSLLYDYLKFPLHDHPKLNP